MSEAEQKALTRESLAYDDELRRRGHFLGANALQPVNSATTVQMRNSRCRRPTGHLPRQKSIWAATS
jgi:hypothetical protein